MKYIRMSKMTKHNNLPILWFFLGFGIFMFSRRSEIVPTIQVAIIIAPVFILRFIRTQPTRIGIFLTLLGFLLSMNIALWGLFEISDSSMMLIFNLVRSSLLAILYFLPYMLDRLVHPKFKEKKVLSTLTFPTIVTAIFFLSSLEGPFDGNTAKTIFAYGNLMFQQLASIAGLWGFIFIFSWLASIINYYWENEFAWKKIKRVTILYTSVVLMIFLFAAIKTSSFMGSGSNPVRIAAVVFIPEDGKDVSMESIFEDKLTSPFEETILKIENLTRIAALNNAKIVTFQEFAIIINKKDESKLIEQYKRIAKKYDIYLSITYAFFSEEGKGANKHLFINYQGEIEIDYSKRYLLGFGQFGETGVFSKGVEVIQTADTPYGRIGVSTCRDMNFSAYIRQAGKHNVDIMLSPSYDWPKSTGPSYSLRAIENGFSFVRPVYNGFSFAVDYNGKILAHMDSDHTEDGIMYADVPIKGVKTIFTIIGGFPGWLCVLGLAIFAGISIKDRILKERNSPLY